MFHMVIYSFSLWVKFILLLWFNSNLRVSYVTYYKFKELINMFANMYKHITRELECQTLILSWPHQTDLKGNYIIIYTFSSIHLNFLLTNIHRLFAKIQIGYRDNKTLSTLRSCKCSRSISFTCTISHDIKTTCLKLCHSVLCWQNRCMDQGMDSTRTMKVCCDIGQEMMMAVDPICPVRFEVGEFIGQANN